MLLKKYLHPFEGVWFFGGKLKANVGVRCSLHIFLHLLEGVRWYLKIFEAPMCYLGVIEVYILVLGVLFVEAFNTYLHIINLILYILCKSLKEISVFFWWGYPGVTVDEEKR